MATTAIPHPLLATATLGEGPESVVLLHGFLGSGKNLRSLAQRWAERAPGRHRFLMMDLPGHGDSPALGPDSDLDALARDVLDAASAAGATDPLYICGHSLGGRVGLAAVRRAPDRVRQVTLLDITPGPIALAASDSRAVLDILVRAPDEVPDRKTMRQHLIGQGLSPGIADWLLMNLEGSPGGVVPGSYRWRFDRQALDRLHVRFTREDLWAVVEQRAVPLRAIRGERSRYLPDADAQRLRENGCPVDTLPEAGHHLHVDALPQLVELLAAD
jgi:esterase